MKKELRVFLILIVGWILLLDFAILKTQADNYIKSQNSIIVRNVISGAAVYYPLNNNSVFSGLVIPLFTYNFLIVISLSMSYYFWTKNKVSKKNITGKKGQASMEFMMTYGWVIMALVVSMAALYSFGVIFKPSGQNVCALGPGISCNDFIVGNNGIAITINNALGKNMDNVMIKITNTPGITCDESVTKNIIDQGTTTFGISCPGLKAGDKFSGDISISYLKEGASLTSTVGGTLTAKIANKNITTDDIGPRTYVLAGNADEPRMRNIKDILESNGDNVINCGWPKIPTCDWQSSVNSADAIIFLGHYFNYGSDNEDQNNFIEGNNGLLIEALNHGKPILFVVGNPYKEFGFTSKYLFSAVHSGGSGSVVKSVDTTITSFMDSGDYYLIYDSEGSYHMEDTYFVDPKGIRSIVDKSDSNKIVLSEIESGTSLYNGLTAGSRIALLAIFSSYETSLSDNGQTLVLNSLNWLTS